MKKKKGRSTRNLYGDETSKSKTTPNATQDTAKTRKSKSSLKAYELTTVSKDEERIVVNTLQVVPSPKRLTTTPGLVQVNSGTVTPTQQSNDDPD